MGLSILLQHNHTCKALSGKLESQLVLSAKRVSWSAKYALNTQVFESRYMNDKLQSFTVHDPNV